MDNKTTPVQISLWDITSPNMTVPEIKSNMQIKPLENIRKHIGESHGMSLLAMTIIDNMHQNLEISVRFPDEMRLQQAVGELISNWRKYQPIASYLRSYRRDGTFITQLDDQVLQNNNHYPGSTDDYKGRKVIIDMESTGSSYTFTFHRYGEGHPRTLFLTAA